MTVKGINNQMQQGIHNSQMDQTKVMILTEPKQRTIEEFFFYKEPLHTIEDSGTERHKYKHTLNFFQWNRKEQVSQSNLYIMKEKMQIHSSINKQIQNSVRKKCTHHRLSKKKYNKTQLPPYHAPLASIATI